jgi:hypothetical protein
MKKITVACCGLLLSLGSARSDDFKTTDGKEYKNATVTQVEADGIVVKTKGGISKVYFAELPKDVQERFHYGSATPGKAGTQCIDWAQRSSSHPGRARLLCAVADGASN